MPGLRFIYMGQWVKQMSDFKTRYASLEKSIQEQRIEMECGGPVEKAIAAGELVYNLYPDFMTLVQDELVKAALIDAPPCAHITVAGVMSADRRVILRCTKCDEWWDVNPEKGPLFWTPDEPIPDNLRYENG